MDERLVVLISALARSAPAPLVKSLAERLSRLDWRQAEHARHTLLAAIPQPAIRTLVQQLLPHLADKHSHSQPPKSLRCAHGHSPDEPRRPDPARSKSGLDGTNR